MRETTRHRAAYERYFRLGPRRTIEQLHEAPTAADRAPSLRTLYEWSRQFHWQARLDDFERRARQAHDATELEAVREMHERQAKEALLLQQKGAEWLAALEGEAASADTAIRAITEGAKLERLVRGAPTERTATTDPLAARLKGLDDGELDSLLTLAERDLAGESPPGARGSLGLGDGPPPDGEPPASAPPGPGSDRA